jgi:hypothetical protein
MRMVKDNYGAVTRVKWIELRDHIFQTTICGVLGRQPDGTGCGYATLGNFPFANLRAGMFPRPQKRSSGSLHTNSKEAALRIDFYLVCEKLELPLKVPPNEKVVDSFRRYLRLDSRRPTTSPGPRREFWDPAPVPISILQLRTTLLRSALL